MEWELYQSDGEFYERPPAADIFEARKVNWTKSKRMTIAGTPRRCAMMKFTLEASEEFMRFACDAGLGQKQALESGCGEVVSSGATEARGGERI